MAGAAFGAKIHQEPEQITETLTGAGGDGKEQELDPALDNQARHDGDLDGCQGDATAEIAQDEHTATVIEQRRGSCRSVHNVHTGGQDSRR